MMGYRWAIPDILAAANMVVIASRHTEASPIVLREAFATGRPIVATRVGDVPEIIVHGENGLILPPSAEALAAGMEELWAARQHARDMGEAAYATLERYQIRWDHILERLVA